MLISTLIISYNTREKTLACLESVCAWTRETDCEVIVLDNASTDDSAEAVAERFPDVKLIASESNHGFARGNNIAAEQATGKYLLLLNPDTVVLDGAIDRLVAFAEADGGGNIYGGRTLFSDGSLNPTSCWRRPSLWSLLCVALGLNQVFPKSEVFNRDWMPSYGRDEVKEVDIISGCFLLIGRDNWERLGGFDERFFMYGEEFDLCLRAARLGMKCKVCPEATIIHHGGASERTRADKTVKLFQTKVLLMREHWSRPAAWLGVGLLRLWTWTRRVGGAVAGLWSQGAKQTGRTWREVGRRRREWRRGPQAT